MDYSIIYKAKANKCCHSIIYQASDYVFLHTAPVYLIHKFMKNT